MCDPTGGVATALMIGGAALGAGSQVYSGIQANKMGKYQNAVAQQNAAYADTQAQDAYKRGDQATVQHFQKVAALRGAQRAGFSALGLDASSGSAADLESDTVQFGNQDANTLRENASREAMGYHVDAQNSRDQGYMAKQQGKAAFTSSLISATGTVLSAASKVGANNLKNAKPQSQWAADATRWQS